MTTFAEQRYALLSELHQNPSGLEWSERYTDLVDHTIRGVYASVESDIGQSLPLTLVAVGGYGRSQLSPMSDLDLVVIPSNEEDSGLDHMLRLLHKRIFETFADGAKLRIDYAYRPLSDAHGLDSKSRTGMMDSRWVAGPGAVLHRFLKELDASFVAGQFVLEKLLEREDYLAKSHSTPLVISPNLKDGAGGLRCLHTAAWLARSTGCLPTSEGKLDVLLRIRNLLQFSAQTKTDELTPQRQGDVAKILGQSHAELMSSVLEALEENYKIYETAKARLHQSEFLLLPGVHVRQGNTYMTSEATVGDAADAVRISLRLGLRIPNWLTQFRPDPNPSKLLAALSSGIGTVRELDEIGLLEQALPELTACRKLLPDDLSHRFTVFEHSLQALNALDHLSGDAAWLNGLYQEIEDRGVLALAILLHDIGKRVDSPRHSEIGADLAGEACRRIGVSVRQRRLVEWLIRHHLLLTRTIQLRDLAAGQTMEDLLNVIQSREQLASLVLLTYCDVFALRAEPWQPLQLALLKEAFERLSALIQDEPLGSDVPPVLARRPAPQKTEESDFLSHLPAAYLVTTDPELMPIHAQMAQGALEGELQVHFQRTTDYSATLVSVCAQDQAGLLSRILGVFYGLGLEVISIRVFTAELAQRVAVDTFLVRFNGRPIPAATQQHLVRQFRDLAGSDSALLEFLTKLDKHAEDFPIDRITVVPGNPAILEVRSDSYDGLAFRVSRFIAQRGWNISYARFGQWASQSTAVFYVSAPTGQVVEIGPSQPRLLP